MVFNEINRFELDFYRQYFFITYAIFKKSTIIRDLGTEILQDSGRVEVKNDLTVDFAKMLFAEKKNEEAANEVKLTNTNFKALKDLNAYVERALHEMQLYLAIYLGDTNAEFGRNPYGEDVRWPRDTIYTFNDFEALGVKLDEVYPKLSFPRNSGLKPNLLEYSVTILAGLSRVRKFFFDVVRTRDARINDHAWEYRDLPGDKDKKLTKDLENNFDVNSETFSFVTEIKKRSPRRMSFSWSEKALNELWKNTIDFGNRKSTEENKNDFFAPLQDYYLTKSNGAGMVAIDQGIMLCFLAQSRHEGSNISSVDYALVSQLFRQYIIDSTANGVNLLATFVLDVPVFIKFEEISQSDFIYEPAIFNTAGGTEVKIKFRSASVDEVENYEKYVAIDKPLADVIFDDFMAKDANEPERILSYSEKVELVDKFHLQTEKLPQTATLPLMLVPRRRDLLLDNLKAKSKISARPSTFLLLRHLSVDYFIDVGGYCGDRALVAFEHDLVNKGVLLVDASTSCVHEGFLKTANFWRTRKQVYEDIGIAGAIRKSPQESNLKTSFAKNVTANGKAVMLGDQRGFFKVEKKMNNFGSDRANSQTAKSWVECGVADKVKKPSPCTQFETVDNVVREEIFKLKESTNYSSEDTYNSSESNEDDTSFGISLKVSGTEDIVASGMVQTLKRARWVVINIYQYCEDSGCREKIEDILTKQAGFSHVYKTEESWSEYDLVAIRY